MCILVPRSSFVLRLPEEYVKYIFQSTEKEKGRRRRKKRKKKKKKEEIFVVRLYKRRLVFGTRNATDN